MPGQKSAPVARQLQCFLPYIAFVFIRRLVNDGHKSMDILCSSDFKLMNSFSLSILTILNESVVGQNGIDFSHYLFGLLISKLDEIMVRCIVDSNFVSLCSAMLFYASCFIL